jgi:hypothetical protein
MVYPDFGSDQSDRVKKNPYNIYSSDKLGELCLYPGY